MTPRAKHAIGRIEAVRGDGGRVSGTAFFVSDRFLLTAFHVVGDRAVSLSSGVGACYPSLCFVSAMAVGKRIAAKVVPNACDAVADWALLEIEEAIAGVVPLPLGEISAHEFERRRSRGKVLEFDSWGFPTLARMAGTGIAIDGRMQDQDAEYQGAWAYQLYSENAAAALGDPLNGLSGAPCLIDGAVVGIIRSNLVAESGPRSNQAVHIVGGILYACPVSTTTLQERCAPYLPALDPIRGLPGLPRQELPREPFRYLHWYGAIHAEVFFGRNRRIRDLYSQVVGIDTPPLVLVYGASGVGKSSLLEAGVLPRLSWNYIVRSQRREAGKTLQRCLDDQLLLAESDSESCGKPAIVLIDQIEEVFIDTGVDGNAELAALGLRIKNIVESRTRVSKVILGFRSEWLANVRARLSEVGISYGEFYLERLARDEIEEVVRGVSATQRMQQTYGVEVDEDLPRRVADDLLDDPDSPVSPLLSIILTRLWAEAKTRRAGEQRLSEDVYDQRMRNKLDLDQFLVEQIRATSLTRPEDVASGLVIDMLYRHTTDHGTAKELSRRELQEIYYQLGQGEADKYLSGLVESLCATSLLYTAEPRDTRENEGQVTRLAHDTLAPPVRKSFQKSDLPGQRAERRLVSWVEDWQPSEPDAGTLDSGSLVLIAQGARGTRGPTENERNFIQASLAARRTSVRRSRRARALFAALLICAGLGAIAWWKEDWLKEKTHWVMYVRGHVLTLTAERALQIAAVFKECVECPEMVVIPGGAFMMGGSADSEAVDERSQAGGLLRVVTQSVVGQPQHRVTIAKPLAISKFEVTFDEWDACFAAGGCKTPGSSQSWGRGKRPVINVSWDDAKEYITWLSRMTGKHYRLLSEAEWEFAARAGTETVYSWGNDVGSAQANCNGCGSEWDNKKTAPVGSFKPNGFGLHDMHGNVWEWVEDCFNEDYNDAPTNGSPSLVGDCTRRVIRGGSWITVPRALRSANRHRDDVNGRYFATGVRIARTLVTH